MAFLWTILWFEKGQAWEMGVVKGGIHVKLYTIRILINWFSSCQTCTVIICNFKYSFDGDKRYTHRATQIRTENWVPRVKKEPISLRDKC